MSTTLTNGLKLPDKGSVDWYSDMQNNYQILDGAVGTVASKLTNVTATELGYLSGVTSAIQTQLNGKAADSDVVHKSGNETIAGEKTFSDPCKTLGKKLLADITDLDDAYYNGEVCGFNPNTLHNPTGGHGNVLTINNAVTVPDNAYNSWITQIATTTNNTYLGSRTRTNGGAWTSWTRILTEAYARPTVTNTYDLGSSSYQWNNLYAKNYFYNGTAWGLDKANTWTAEQIIEQATVASFKLKNSNMQVGNAIPSSLKTVGSLAFNGSDGVNFGYMDLRDSALGNTFIRILARQKYDANGNRSASGTTYDSGIDIGVLNDKTPFVVPTSNAIAQLGSSTNKWKTLNGINPGALSLPSFSYSGTNAIVEISGWVADGTNNSYSPPADGWLSISNGGNITVWGVNTAFGMHTTDNIAIPLRYGETYNVSMTHTPDFCRFYPCLGNV